MATTEIGNGCGLSTEAVLASNHKRRRVYQAGASRRGKDFAARHAECVFVSGPSAGIVRNYVRDIRQRAAELGRAQILIFAMYTIIVAPTESEALAKLHEYRTYIDYEGALALMSGWTGVNLGIFDLDEELRSANTNANQSALESFTTGDPNRRWKIRDIAEFVGLGGRGPVVVGSPSQVADLRTARSLCRSMPSLMAVSPRYQA